MQQNEEMKGFFKPDLEKSKKSLNTSRMSMGVSSHNISTQRSEKRYRDSRNTQLTEDSWHDKTFQQRLEMDMKKRQSRVKTSLAN